MWLSGLGFTVMGLVSRVSLANNSNAGAWLSCLLLHCSQDRSGGVLDCMSPTPMSPKITYILTFPSISLEYFLRAIWNNVSWASFLILSQKTVKAQLTLCTLFIFSWHNLSFQLSLNKNRRKKKKKKQKTLNYTFSQSPNLTYLFTSKAFGYCKHSGLRKGKYLLAEFTFFLCAFEMYSFYPVFFRNPSVYRHAKLASGLSNSLWPSGL